MKTRLLAVTFLLLMVMAAWWMRVQVGGAVADLRMAVKALKEFMKPMQTLTSSWKDANGVQHTVSTPRNEGETTDQWTARHQAAVAALQAIYKPA